MRPIRQRAHAATLFVGFWTLLSVGGVVSLIDSWRHGVREYQALTFVACVLLIHTASIVYAIHLWKTEKPKPASGISGFIIDDLLDTNPQSIDLVRERVRLKRIILGDVSGFVWLMLVAWLTHVAGFLNMGVLFGGIFFLHVVLETGKYYFLKKRAQMSLEQ